MHVTARSYLTAGVAAVGAGAIALAPVQPIPNQVALAPERAVSNLAVNLAAAIDPITPWVDAISAAAENAYNLQNTWYEKPFPILQTIIQNQMVYFSEFPNIGLIVKQVLGNIGNALKAPFAVDPQNINPNPVTYVNIGVEIGVSQQLVWAALPEALGAETYAKLKPLLDLTTTPISGFLLGFGGPGLSSMLQLKETFQNIVSPPPGAKFLLNAINEIINLPANLFNAAFNGGKTLDLTNLANKIAPLPDTVKSIGIATGGFLNQGGVAFDGLAADASLGGLNVQDPGWDVGFIGATGTLANYVADAIKVTPPAATASTRPAAASAVEAPAVEAPAVEAPAVEAPPKVSVPDVADEASAPKRLNRTVAKADTGGKGAARGERSAVRRAG